MIQIKEFSSVSIGKWNFGQFPFPMVMYPDQHGESRKRRRDRKLKKRESVKYFF